MASYTKRGDTVTAIVRRKGVTQIATFKNKTLAQQWATRTEADILAGKTGNVLNKTFGELLSEYAIKVSPTKKGERWEIVRINLIKRDPIANVSLSKLCSKDFADWRDRRLTTVSSASVRREWVLLSNAVNIAINEWQWLTENPMKGVKVPAHSPPRDRIATDEELELLLFTLGYNKDITPDGPSERIGASVLFALETGMRAGEIVDLNWKNVNLKGNYCKVSDGKTLSAKRDVPLSTEAIRILKQMKTIDSVFELRSSQVDALFRKARDKAGITGLHYHDLRHTAVTRLAKKLSVLELARMIGHRDLRQLQVYYNESATNLAKLLD